jgi:hypothetical protein
VLVAPVTNLPLVALLFPLFHNKFTQITSHSARKDTKTFYNGQFLGTKYYKEKELSTMPDTEPKL